ncbi:4-hydroxyphenylacetate 3-monooxygenase, oxygenase component [Ammoniphilus sp. CFH 90114]|uniref:4-hydroxyphenylacetate 3-monooxygenase, oxygenase component n=1 Tax=Ammoniphilus sp. CFH 90114 TaxID=2493665 RepID=UPI00100E9F12|nr:4-hydroxyphenylacetate 3-monooxygenase, oxygenase component [Ammoniphilus sp. CFH 90114]RXT06335.1 4-hydroxyphenylacetate 3-monooxygenase, oxygenase component [Ammoniphilus sp. CFH 90114]
MPIRTGQEYVSQLRKSKPTIWLKGKKVKNMNRHPSFRGLIESQAALYDLQHDPSKKRVMTYTSPLSGDLVGTSFMQPRTKEDLEQRRFTIQEWATYHAGMMGRSPDYMNTMIMALSSAAALLTDQDPMLAENMRSFYEHCRENDLALSHTFIGPKSIIREDSDAKSIAACIVDKNDDGIIIDGMRLMATKGGTTDEILVVSNTASLFSETDPHTFAFAIPTDTPGLQFICREPLSYGTSTYDYPLSSRFEEMDSIVLFDRVLVPWNRVFFYERVDIANKLYRESNVNHHITHQVLCKSIVKSEFALGVLQLMTDTTKVGHHPHVKEKIGEIIVTLEMLKALLLSSEVNAQVDRWGNMLPAKGPLWAARQYFPKMYPRIIEIMQLIGASGLVTIPSEEDFYSEIGHDLNFLLQSEPRDGYEKIKLFRLAWDLCMSAFGTRQVLYERFFFGDPIRKAEELYEIYDRSSCVARVEEFLKRHKKKK